MKYFILTLALLTTLSASAETLSGHVLQVKDNVAYIKTADGQKVPVILGNKTYYRKRRIGRKGKETFEFYQPLMGRGDNVTLTYDAETVDARSGAVKASDVLIISNN